MSHMSKIELIIKDLEVLKMACRHLNLEYSGDTAKFSRRGCEVADEALAVIVVLGVQRVISVVPEGEAFALRALVPEQDAAFGHPASGVGRAEQRPVAEAPGRKGTDFGRKTSNAGRIKQKPEASVREANLDPITEAVGQIKQRYAVEHVLAEARNKRMRVQETVTETGIRLVLTAY